MENENDIDQLFKNGLSDPEIPFNELDWEKMERKLDGTGEKKRLIPMWLYAATAAAAVLAVVLFWWLGNPLKIDQHKIEALSSVEPGNSGTKTYKGELEQSDFQPQAPDQETNTIDRTNDQGRSGNYYPELTAENDNNAITLKGMIAEAELPVLPFSGLVSSTAGKKPEAALHPIPTPIQSHKTIPHVSTAAERETAELERKANALAQSKDPLEKMTATEIARSVQKNMETALTRGNTLILSAMAAPDISTAKDSKSSKVSSNLGMLATYALSSKFSLTSGAVYAKKYYNSAGVTQQGNSYGSGANWEVDANCDVLDIPINVNYKLLKKKRLSLSVNTGLSSYFMLKEKYQFISGTAGAGQQVSTLELQNQNKHLFGIANVSVSLDHQINESFSVGVQPFVKLPLTGIGNGDVDLKSVGVSFSLNIGLFPAKKVGKYASTNVHSSPSGIIY